MSRDISYIAWEPDGTILVTFLESGDIRCEGHVALRQTIRIEPTNQYADGIQAVADAAHELIRDAIEDWKSSPAADDGSERPLGTDPELDLLTRPHLAAESDEDEDSLSERRKWAAIEAARATEG